MGKLHYIRDDWYPKNATEAADMTAGGKSTFGGGMTSVFRDDRSKCHTKGFTKKNPDGYESKWYCTTGIDTRFIENGDNCNKIFQSAGMTVKSDVYAASNFLFEIGTGLDSGPSNESILGENGTTAIRNVVGFSMGWTQYADSRNPAVIAEKVGLVYASNERPFGDSRCSKYLIPAQHKLAGDPIGDKTDVSKGERWASYSVGEYQSDLWKTIKQKKLHWIGLVIQTYCKRPIWGMGSGKIKIKNFRPLVCTGADWGHTALLNKQVLYNHWRGSGIVDCYNNKIGIANL